MSVLVGFIGELTNLHFGEACNKERLTAGGKIRRCLGDRSEIGQRAALRVAADEGKLR